MAYVAPYRGDEVIILPGCRLETLNSDSGVIQNRTAQHRSSLAGGSSGFGAAISRSFLAEGAKVYIGDIQLGGVEAIANEYPGQAIAGHLDVTIRAEWDAAIANIEKHFGTLGILVNNAGTSHRNKTTLEVTEEEFRRTFDVNCLGIFHSVQAVFPIVIKQDHVVCLNISSVRAERPRRGLVWYNASKGAVSKSTKGPALEYGSARIRVNSISPLLSSTGLFEPFTGVADKSRGSPTVHRECPPWPASGGR
ncbi:Hypothetical protein NCS54_01376400 [Fusarium falciforme]|uniref:Hypothetical protein n=1 Tax=Fusarium falciforme TaxID=195108 RepID=UPI00230109DE|nr:Hypothetical protein NCS54_01376400 [Fusarium falciforme]WAO96102.1 Hypothetical protein NCS54_01376400 [Fusarium falciforme]